MLNVFEYLEQSAARSPGKLAFADSSRSLSFSELLAEAGRVGRFIAERTGIRKPVAVLTDRNVDSLAAFMGALAAGCFYVPLDAQMPPKRLGSILSRLGAEVVIDSAGGKAKVEGAVPFSEAVSGEADWSVLDDRRSRVLDIDPVYVIFTSGSTGEPKGIVCHHRGVMDIVDWLAEAGGFTEDDVLGGQAPFYFDLSVKDIYLTLKCGACCHILDRRLFMFPPLLVKELAAKEVTALVWATSAFHLTANSGALEGAQLPRLRTVILGGEALRAKQLNIWRTALPHVRYVNLYGPTEVTVDCTWYPIEREFADGESIPIGKACRNMEVFLLGEDLKPVPDGEPGEICVRGTGLAHGYFGDPVKTAECFIPDPRPCAWPDRIYRTGDLARVDEHGDLVFLSRRDGQIKHMGYRIELGELENALSSIEGVKAAVSFFDAARDKIVCVYEGEAEADAIGRELRDWLPKYMLPNVYRRLGRLPYNANGKVDRVRLRDEYFNGQDS